MNKKYFQFADGRRLAWCETGAGPPLVMLHGWAMSSAAFSEVACLLSADYRLMMPDLPGHGDSSPARQSDLSGLVADLVDWLKETVDGPVILSGWSLGGMLSIKIACDGAIPVEQMILVGTTPRFTNSDDWSFGLPATQVHVMLRNLKRRFESTLGDFFALTFAEEKISKERLRTIRNFAVRNHPLPDRDVAAELLQVLACQDQREDLSRIQQPVLVIHGSSDRVSPVEAGRYISETVTHGEFIGMDGVGHAPFLSRPEEFVARLREFI